MFNVLQPPKTDELFIQANFKHPILAWTKTACVCIKYVGVFLPSPGRSGSGGAGQWGPSLRRYTHFPERLGHLCTLSCSLGRTWKHTRFFFLLNQVKMFISHLLRCGVQHHFYMLTCTTDTRHTCCRLYRQLVA